MPQTETEPNPLSRIELLQLAQSLGVIDADVMTRAELRAAIEKAKEPAPPAVEAPKTWVSVARRLLASVIERGLNLPDAAALIRGDAKLSTPPKPPPPVATVTLARIYAAQGHLDRAIFTLDEVLLSDPDHELARDLRAMLELRRQELQARDADAAASAPRAPDELTPLVPEVALREAAAGGAGVPPAPEASRAVPAAASVLASPALAAQASPDLAAELVAPAFAVAERADALAHGGENVAGENAGLATRAEATAPDSAAPVSRDAETSPVPAVHDDDLRGSSASPANGTTTVADRTLASWVEGEPSTLLADQPAAATVPTESAPWGTSLPNDVLPNEIGAAMSELDVANGVHAPASVHAAGTGLGAATGSPDPSVGCVASPAPNGIVNGIAHASAPDAGEPSRVDSADAGSPPPSIANDAAASDAVAFGAAAFGAATSDRRALDALASPAPGAESPPAASALLLIEAARRERYLYWELGPESASPCWIHVVSHTPSTGGAAERRERRFPVQQRRGALRLEGVPHDAVIRAKLSRDPDGAPLAVAGAVRSLDATLEIRFAPQRRAPLEALAQRARPVLERATPVYWDIV